MRIKLPFCFSLHASVKLFNRLQGGEALQECYLATYLNTTVIKEGVQLIGDLHSKLNSDKWACHHAALGCQRCYFLTFVQ